MQSALDRYREMSLDRFPTENIKKLSDDMVKENRDDFPGRASSLFLSYDLEIVCSMLDEGYSLGETTEVLNKHSMFAYSTKGICTPEDFRRHADSVMVHVNEVRERKIGEKYELAKKFYLSRSNGKTLGKAQEGGIILSMLAGGFSPDVVEKVVSDCSLALKDDPVLACSMIDDCVQIRRFYNTLQNTASPSSIHRGSSGAYKYFASEYLRETKSSALSVQGDRVIARQMLAAGLNEDFISKALRHSPIASEPWRDKKQYIEAVLSRVKDIIKQQKYADDRYMFTASMYDDKIRRLLEAVKKKARSYGIMASRAYCDGIVARELLEEHQLRTNVERVISKKSPEAKKNLEQANGRNGYSYGKSIVAAAFAVLRAEAALLKYSIMSLPEVSTFAELKERGFTVGDLYKDAVHRRIRSYPSTAGMLTAPFLDRDVAENLMTRYPDIERMELEQAIRENSPRAQMSGIGKSYPSVVLENVHKRMENLAEQKKRQSEYQKKMREQTKSEKNAFVAGSPLWNITLCTGLVAIRMLQEGHSAMDILPALIQPPDIKEHDAIQIMSHAEDVLARMDRIRQYVPLTNAGKELLETKAHATDDYIRLYQSAQMNKDKLMSDIDVEIAKNMMLNGYSLEDVQEAVRSNSPVSAEPGRTADYSSYVTEQAELAIEKEKERLKLYRPMPRNDHENDAEKEYEYHLNNIRSSFFLPYETSMDRLVAETMLVQGFQAAAIGAAIQHFSPCAESNERYGMEIMQSLESAKSSGLAQEGPVRVRAIEGV